MIRNIRNSVVSIQGPELPSSATVAKKENMVHFSGRYPVIIPCRKIIRGWRLHSCIPHISGQRAETGIRSIRIEIPCQKCRQSFTVDFFHLCDENFHLFRTRRLLRVKMCIEKIEPQSRFLVPEQSPCTSAIISRIRKSGNLFRSFRKPERSLVQQFEFRRFPKNGHGLLRSIGIRRRRDLSRIPSQTVPSIIGAMLRQIGDLMRLRLLKSQKHRTLTSDHRHACVPAVSPHVGPVGCIINPDVERHDTHIDKFLLFGRQSAAIQRIAVLIIRSVRGTGSQQKYRCSPNQMSESISYRYFQDA